MRFKLGEMIFLTGQALDRDNWQAVRDAGLPMGAEDDPLTNKETVLLIEDQYPIAGVPNADLSLAHTVLYQRRKYLAARVEFHFRNDATRKQWGDATPEVDLPDRQTQLQAAEAARGRVATQYLQQQQLGFLCELVLDDLEPQDRHTLWILIPMDWAVAQFCTMQTSDCHNYRRFIQQVLSPEEKGWDQES